MKFVGWIMARLQPLPACGERSDRRGEAELRRGVPGEGEPPQANWRWLEAVRQPRCGTAGSIASPPRLLKLPLTRNSLARISTSARKRGEVHADRCATFQYIAGWIKDCQTDEDLKIAEPGMRGG